MLAAERGAAPNTLAAYRADLLDFAAFARRAGVEEFATAGPDTLRDYLYPIAANRIRGVRLPGPIQRRLEAFALLITTGFLPQRFRDEMRLPWDDERQRAFDRVIAVLRTVNHALPSVVRQFPFNVLLKDLDRRVRTGRPLI